MNKVSSLKDSSTTRWMILFLISLTMFAAYLAADVFSPLKTMLETNNGWNSLEYGWFSSSYSIFNVFLGMLIIGGLILDKKGIRFSGLASCLLMILGIGIKYWAVSTPELTQTYMTFLGTQYKEQVAWAVLGSGIFGVGAEVGGLAVSKAVVKWFKGKEMAMAMGLQLALARLGKGAALIFSPKLAAATNDVSTPVLLGLILLVVGGLSFCIYCLYDKKLDRQIQETQPAEKSFELKDVKNIVTNYGFWLIALLCVVFYSAVLPFIKYATDLMVNKYSVDPSWAGTIPALVPFGCVILAPLFGRVYDRHGHGLDLMVLGSLMITCVHIVFALPFNNWIIAVVLMIMLGIGYAVVPSAMWPSLAKIIPESQYGTAIALTYYIQNIGLWGMPVAIGYVLDEYCVSGVRPDGSHMYDYTVPMLIFAGVSALSLLIVYLLRRANKSKGYGLQEKNIK